MKKKLIPMEVKPAVGLGNYVLTKEIIKDLFSKGQGKSYIPVPKASSKDNLKMDEDSIISDAEKRLDKMIERVRSNPASIIDNLHSIIQRTHEGFILLNIETKAKKVMRLFDYLQNLSLSVKNNKISTIYQLQSEISTIKSKISCLRTVNKLDYLSSVSDKCQLLEPKTVNISTIGDGKLIRLPLTLILNRALPEQNLKWLHNNAGFDSFGLKYTGYYYIPRATFLIVERIEQKTKRRSKFKTIPGQDDRSAAREKLYALIDRLNKNKPKEKKLSVISKISLWDKKYFVTWAIPNSWGFQIDNLLSTIVDYSIGIETS